MTEEMKENDATRYIVVRLNLETTGPEPTVVCLCDSEGLAIEEAKNRAQNDESSTHYGVYQKIGTARAAREVKWKGAAR